MQLHVINHRRPHLRQACAPRRRRSRAVLKGDTRRAAARVSRPLRLYPPALGQRVAMTESVLVPLPSAARRLRQRDPLHRGCRAGMPDVGHGTSGPRDDGGFNGPSRRSRIARWRSLPAGRVGSDTGQTPLLEMSALTVASGTRRRTSASIAPSSASLIDVACVQFLSIVEQRRILAPRDAVGRHHRLEPDRLLLICASSWISPIPRSAAFAASSMLLTVAPLDKSAQAALFFYVEDSRHRSQPFRYRHLGRAVSASAAKAMLKFSRLISSMRHHRQPSRWPWRVESAAEVDAIAAIRRAIAGWGAAHGQINTIFSTSGESIQQRLPG